MVIFIKEYNVYIKENRYPFKRDGERETGREGKMIKREGERWK